MEDTDPSRHLRSEYLYPNGFLRVLLLRSECLYPNGFLRVLLLLLPLSTHLFLCEPRILAFGLGERLGNTRRVRLLSVVPPVLGLIEEEPEENHWDRGTQTEDDVIEQCLPPKKRPIQTEEESP